MYFSVIGNVYTRMIKGLIILFQVRYLEFMTSQVALMVKNPPAKAGDIKAVGSIPGPGRYPGGGHGNPLQYLCLEHSMDRGTWESQSLGLQRVRLN